MEYLVGGTLALGAGLFATKVRLDQDRGFYPTVLIVIATYYDLFAAMSGSAPILGAEALVSAVFICVAVVGFRTNLWLVVGALFGHGVFDFFHAGLIANPGTPAWWPAFCLAYDVVAAGYLASRLLRAKAEGAKASEPTVRVTSKRQQRRAAHGQFLSRIRPHVWAELRSAANTESAGDAATSFRHLERAHVLAQSSTVEHVKVHVRMLGWGLRNRDRREVFGQLVRILGAATTTPVGLVPVGNTGGANVSPIRPLPIPPDLAAIIEGASKPGVAATCFAVLVLAVGLSGSGQAATADDARTVNVFGKTVAYSVLGSGKPTLVLLSGLGDGTGSSPARRKPTADRQ